MSVEEQLKEIILERFKSVRAFTQVVGVPYSTMDSALKRGITNAGIGTMLKVFAALELDIESVADGTLRTKAEKNAPDITSEAYRVAKDYDALDIWGQRTLRAVADSELARITEPEKGIISFKEATKSIDLLSNSFAAGAGEPDFGNVFGEKYEVPADSPAEFAIRINGDSMEPYLPDGSIALCRKNTPKDGDVGAFLIDGEFLVKQMCIDITGTLHLFSLNRGRKNMDRHLGRDEDHTVWCFGTVIMKHVQLPLD